MDVTEDTLLNGISKPRNQLLFDNAVYLLPYVGIGSGIVRAFKDFKDITIENNLATEEFVVTIKRPDEMTKPPIVVDNVVDNVVDKTPELSERQQRILNLIKEDRSISSAIISNALSVNPRTIQREILKLKSAGLISRIGPDNGGYISGWSFAEEGTTNARITSRIAEGVLGVQDYYHVEKPEVKVKAVSDFMDWASDNSVKNAWTINHTSGYTGVISTDNTYRENAANNNPTVYRRLINGECSATGMIMMDWVGNFKSGRYEVYGDLLPQAIINNNFNYFKK